MKILVINCGSSSVKYKLFKVPSFKLIKKGLIEKIGERNSCVKNHHQAILKLFGQLKAEGIDNKEIIAVGHRVVHGGEKFKEPAIIDKKVIKEIRRNIELASLHNPKNLAGILACKKILPKVKQVAIFDTAFYQSIPSYAHLYGLPFRFYKKCRIRRYGFHGTSHQYIAGLASRALRRPLSQLKLITVHLGNGCSISAIDRGRCVDTSMGFTPLEGLIMGTRCGDIDPAVVFYMARRLKININKIDEIFNKESGLLGVSGISNDVRLIKRALKKRNARARLALDMFIYRIRKYIASYIGVLEGADAIVFTAGIGENNPDIVRKITHNLNKFLKDKVRILILPTDEELMIAKLSYGKIKSGRL